MSKISTIVLLFLFNSAIGANMVNIDYKEYRLDNGLRLIIHEDHKAPIVAVNIWYHVGSKNEVKGKTGFAHLFEHLMFNGSENYNDEFFKPFERVGATSMNGTTYFDRTNYFENVPNTALDMALWMESDRMGHMLGAITQERLDEQRGVVQNEKRQGDNQPYGMVQYHLLEGIFPEDHPYSWSTIGSMEDLDSASLEDVHKWFKKYYGPNNAVIVIAGDVQSDQVFEKVKKYFGDIKPSAPVDKMKEWTVRLDTDKREIIRDDVPQIKIHKAWGGPSFRNLDSDILQLADLILTSGKTSRLYNRLVYKDQIATDVDSYQFSGDIGGFYYIEASVQPNGDHELVKKAINEELERFLKDGPSKSEMRRAKMKLRSSFLRGLEKVGGFGGKSDILAQNAVYTGDPGYYKKSLEMIEDASREDIMSVANKWLSRGTYNLEVHPTEKLVSNEEGVDRSSVPVTETFPESKFIKFQKEALSNGLNLVVAKQEDIPIVSFNLLLDAGYAADQYSAPGTSSMVMSMLDEGTEKMDALEISDRASEIGAIISSGAGIDTSSVSMNALRENLDDSLKLYSEIILEPSFPDRELERIRNQKLAQIQQEKNQPFGIALRVLPELLYGESHAYSLPLTGSGTEESVMQIDRQSLINYHNEWFKPNNATMIIVGDVEMDQMKPMLEKHFKNWKSGIVPKKDIADVTVAKSDSVYLIDRPGSQQSIVLAANIAPGKGDSDDLAIESMNDVIGGSFTSRINMNLREDKGWAYGARTTLLQTKGQRPFIAYAPVQTDKTAESIIEIKQELSEFLTTNPVTEDELQKVKDNNTLSLPGRWETVRAISSDLSQIITYGLPDDYWDTYTNKVRNLSSKKLQDAAVKAIKPDNLIWVIVGDLSEIEDKVRNLDFTQIKTLNADGKEIKN
tara:strand:+ start:12294 stop:15017 length:2724 start_codon:yes stop_codon:yes gene_type:complete